MPSRSPRPISRACRTAAVVAAAALTLAACGGDDEEAADVTAAPTTTAAAETASTTAPDTTTATTAPTTTVAATAPAATAPMTTAGEGDDDMTTVSGLDDLPDECVDALADFLRAIEPTVAEIDWDVATLSDFEEVSALLDAEGQAFDDQTEAACGDFDLATDAASLQALIDFAEEEAPGVVGWLEFIQQLTEDAPTAADLEGGPATCEEAIAYIEELAAEGKTMSDLPMADLATVGQAFNVITTDCSPEVGTEFFGRPEIGDFTN